MYFMIFEWCMYTPKIGILNSKINDLFYCWINFLCTFVFEFKKAE